MLSDLEERSQCEIVLKKNYNGIIAASILSCEACNTNNPQEK